MKKTVKKILVSLALCATAFCFVGGLVPFMNTTEASATTAYYTLDGFTIDETAAIRKIEPNGIRFTTELSEETKNAIKDLNLSNVTYGTLLLPADLLGAKELTHSTEKVADSVANIWWEEGTKYTTVLAGKSNGDGTFANLSESYYNRPIAARSYVKGTNSDGDTVVYYAKNTAVRSIGYVAVMAQLNPEEPQSDLVDEIASKTNIELVLNPEGQVSAVQNKNDGTGYISNAFEESSNAVAALKIGGVIAPAGTAGITYSTEDNDVIDINGETITAKTEGSATITATCTFNGVTYNLEKTIATDAYKAESSYKILITQETENASLISQMSYLPPQGDTAYDTYYRAYEKSAAYKLQSVLAEATGHEVPIVVETGSESTADKYISVGETQLAKKAGITLSVKKDTGSEVQTVGETTFILGKTYQGTYYGVQELLGEVAGYEFFMENTYVVDKKVEIVLPQTATYEPDVEWNVSQSYINSAGIMHEHGMQIYTEKIIPIGIGEKESSAYYHEGIAHNSTRLINTDLEIKIVSQTIFGTTYDDKYDNAPAASKEFYATYTSKEFLTYGQTLYHRMLDNGDADNDGDKTEYIKAELCYTAHGTNKRATMVTTVAEEMYKQLKKYPSLERLGFSQADHRVWCECGSCTAQGNPTDNLLIFLLDVAEALETKLKAAGDERAETFKISTLFYHSTNANPSTTLTHTTQLTKYMKHVEPWFAETGLDHIDPFNDTNGRNNWNETVYGYLKEWAKLCDTYGSDMLLWEYYANTESFFIPYDTVNAIRVNYGLFADLGIDYIFNQMMGSKQTWARLKQYLISELIWNAHPDDDTFNGWMTDYFNGSYGAGSAKMQEYYESMHKWSQTDEVLEAFRADNKYDTEGATNSSLGFDVRSSTYFNAETLTNWINLIDEALEALDVTDPNYETYRRNIMLEKLTPMYLIMWVCDGYKPVMSTVSDWLPNPDVDGTFDTTTYVNKYGREFLTWVKEWNIIYDGEGDNRVLRPFLSAIRTELGIEDGDEGTVAPITYVTETQYVAKSSSATISNAAFVDGSYTVTIDNASVNATAVNGTATFDTTALSSGNTYTMTFVCGDVKVIFINVAIVTNTLSVSDTKPSVGGYYAISKNYYVEPGETQATIVHGIFEKGKTYDVTVDGVVSSATTYTAGKLNVTLNASIMGEAYKVICADGDYTYIFTVIAAKHIYTAEQLKALGVGGKAGTFEGVNNGVPEGEPARNWGNGNSDVNDNDVTGYYVLANDIDCAGVVFAAGYGYQGTTGSYFQATLDGNGHTLSNVTVNEGGIFGSLLNATIKDVRFEDVIYNNSLGNYAGNWGNYTALFGHKAINTKFENITIDVKQTVSANKWELLEGLFVASTQNNVTYSNITVNAQNLALETVLGSNLKAVTYNNVVIRAEKYIAIGYTDSEFPTGDTSKQNVDALLTEWPEGVDFKVVTETYNVTTTETTIGLNSSLTITTDNANLTYTYELASMIIGVTVEGNTVTVGENATVGSTFKVIVVGSNGQEEELIFTITKSELTFDEVPTIETTVDNNFTLPYSVEGNVQKISANGYVYYDAAKGIGSIVDRVVTPAAMPVAQEYLGKAIPMTIETATAVYTGAMNVYTMIIDNVAELDSWQAVSAQVAVDQGLCLEVQKGFVYSGYFVLGDNIEYNKVWWPYKAAASGNGGGNELWGLVYSWDAAAGASVVRSDLKDANGNLLEGVIEEDWGQGNKAGFKGVFDGDGHYISGMEIKGEYNAFIVTMGGGTVKDVAFTNAKIGSTASLVANRGNGFFENIYVQVTAMESGVSGKSTQVLMKTTNSNNNRNGMENVIVDVSAIEYASLTWAYVANLANGRDNIYVVGMPEGITLNYGGDNDTEEIVVFRHCNTYEGSTADYDDAGAFVDYKALLSDTDIATWGGLWNVTAKNEILFGDYMIFDNLVIKELDDVVTISIKDETFELPASIEGTVTDVEFSGVSILTGVDGNVVSFNKELMPTTAAQLGEGKALVIKTSEATYNLKANVYTDIITTTQELRDLGVGGMVYTDRKPTYNNSTSTDAGAGGNANSKVAGNDVTGYYLLGNDLDFAGETAVAAGYTWQESWFKGIFDGNDHTIYNIAVNEGGIFGSLRNATIKNVNFVDVVYDMSLGIYAGQYSQQTALLAHVADSSTIKDINVQVSEVKRSANGYAWATLVYNFWNSCTVEDVTIDASYLELSNVLGTDSQSKVSYDNVIIKAASYATIGKQGSGSTELIEWPDGVFFETVTEGVILNRPTTSTGNVIATYKEDATGFGFAADANVFKITSTYEWNDRIVFPVSTAYDYVEFDIYLTENLNYLTGWPARDGATQGDMSIYARGGMSSGNGLVRTVQVFDANGNGTEATNFVANKLYTIRIGFNDKEAVELNQFHVGPHAAQTYYVSAARFGNYSDTEMRIYDASRNVLPYYDGDVTALGFAAGTKVTAATTTNGWSHRVRVNGDLNFDYVDLQFSLSNSDVGGLTVWMYGTDGAMLSTSYSVSTTNVNPSAADGPAKTIQIFDANGRATSVAKFAANTVYTIRVYLDGATAFDFGIFDVSVTMNFGKISYGNVTDLDETVQIEVEGGSFALPTTIEGTVTSVKFEGTEILSRVEGGKAIINSSAVTTFGQEKALSIKTTEGTYSLYADVATKFITTTQELRDLGVGGKVYTDKKPTYNNSTSTDAGAGGNANSGVAGNDVTGYYMLANDLDFAGEKAVAAGYTWQNSWFKGTFDGNGYTIYNIAVNEGGIFGSLRNATIKNVNFVDVVYDMSLGIYAGQYSQQTALLAHVADSSTIKDINVQVSEVKRSAEGFAWATLVYNFWNSCTVEDVTIDASGWELSSVLGTDSQSKVTYTNVNIKAASYATIGKQGSTELTAWPTGVTFKYSYHLNVVPLANSGSTLPVYTGDVTKLGFAAGTKVYEAVQDNRNAIWANASTGETGKGDLGFTMEQQRVRITKGVNEDYASVQFSLSRAVTSTQLFFAWYMAEAKAGGLRHATNIYLNKDGSSGNSDGFSAVAFDMSGKKATSFVPGEVYELRWYDANHIAYGFEFGCCEHNGQVITVYFANPSSGKGQLLNNTSNANLPIYTGDVTKLGFEEGTSVQYRTEEYDLVGGASNWWKSGEAVEINGEIFDCRTNVARQSNQPRIYANADYDVVCIEFALSEAVASGNVFHVWAYDEDGTHLNTSGGAVSIGQTWAESGFAGAIYDKDGNIATSLEANTVYVLKLRMDGAYSYNFANIAESAMTIYYSGIVTYESEAE